MVVDLLANVNSFIPVATLFGGAGGVVLVFLLTKADGGFATWRKNRKIRKESSIVVITGRLEKLEAESAASAEVLKTVVVFIQGTPDPFLRTPEGTPVVTGGLLEFMRKIEKRLPALKENP